MPRKEIWTVFLVAVFVLAGCTGVDYKMQEIEIDTSRYEVLGEAEASVTGIHLFGIFPIGLNSKIQKAVEKAVEQKPGGEQLVNMTVKESWFWAYVLNGYKVKVQGTVIKAK